MGEFTLIFLNLFSLLGTFVIVGNVFEILKVTFNFLDIWLKNCIQMEYDRPTIPIEFVPNRSSCSNDMPF